MMEVFATKHFDRSYAKAPVAIQRAFVKQIDVLRENFHYPSLRAKKYDVVRWQARVTRDWRFYFRIEGGTCLLLDIVHHPK